MRMSRIRVIVGLILAILVIMGRLGSAQESSAERIWFPIGEELAYRVYWGLVPVGEAVVTTAWDESSYGRKLIRVPFRSKSNKVLATLYPVDDVLEVLIDPTTFLPVEFRKDLSEGHYWCKEVTTFDHDSGKAWMYSHKWTNTTEIAINPDTRDSITFMYYTRGIGFVPGAETQVVGRVLTDDKLYDVYMERLGREKVKTVQGKRIPSIKYEPTAACNGLFNREGRVWMWVSDSKHPLVTKMALKIPVASVKVVLDEVRNEGEGIMLPLPASNEAEEQPHDPEGGSS
jgi:hypothetical protein